MTAAQWARIPRELRDRRQWVLAGADKAPRTTAGANASVTDPTTWTDFDTACAAALWWGWLPGYVLTKDDPLTCIDLDVTDDTTPEQMQRFASIVQTFDSYSERSRSGRGLHIWVEGSVGPGRKRDGVEVYSEKRFIICTGDVWLDRPIEQRQALLATLVAEMNRGQETTPGELIEVPPVEPDEAVYWKARSLSKKFDALWAGNWRAMGCYPSQSEADFALMGLLAHATASNEQCRRLFRWSGLGQREKARKNNRYLNYTLRRLRATLVWLAQVQAGWLR